MKGTRLKVLFISRGSANDGMGHVIRSRSVAAAMKDFAHVKMVVIGDEYVENLLVGKQIEYTIIAYDKQIGDIYYSFAPEIVIFDLTYFDEDSFTPANNSNLTVSLSPIFNLLSKIDLVFHRTSIMDKNWSTFGQKPVIKAGLKYATINEHCRKIDEDVYWENLKHERLAIAISMGGTDAANKALQVLDTVKRIQGQLLIWVLLGEGYSHSYQNLVDCMRDSQHEIILAKTNESMWRILSTCSLAVLAGGTTTYESAYAGLPSINTLESEDRFFLIQELVEKGVCLCAGHTFEESIKALNPLISHFNQNRHELYSMLLKSNDLIDNQGAKRIIDETLKYYWKRQTSLAKTTADS
jgi:spore coat polysaccharide biosynthesis predicted glycosyltransferase SpsG